MKEQEKNNTITFLDSKCGKKWSGPNGKKHYLNLLSPYFIS
jgi:hypothetical protein